MPLTERAPPDWEPTGGGSLTLRCPGYAGPAANQTPGPLPSEVLPIVVQNDCAFPIQFSIAFPEDGGQRDYACGPHIWGPPPPAQGDGMCVQGATLIPANQTAVLDATLWGPGRSLPQGLAFSASIPLSEPTHWLSAGLNGSRCVGEDTSNGSDPFFQQEVWAPVPVSAGLAGRHAAKEVDGGRRRGGQQARRVKAVTTAPASCVPSSRFHLHIVQAINATDGTVTMTEDAKLVLSCDPSKVTLRRPDEPPAFPNKPCPL